LSFENEGSATVTVSDDTAATAAVVQEFVDKYNEIVAFINSGNLVTRQEEGDEVDNIFSPLAKTSVDDGILSQIRSNFSASSYSSGDAVRIFADLGITTERDGTLLFDQEEFEDALSDEPESVRNILQNFGDVAGVTGGTIDQYTRFNGLIDIVVNGNKDLISDLNDQIARAEASILREEETLRQRFARLEGLIGQLQNQQAALSSALSSLGTG
ncbi:MAG: flagellar filament capping protein FliD, partial [Bdellovibrionales bacterium]|nr:flagellar filament capping protein FliD [Bdellovibrionales bacterium]